MNEFLKKYVATSFSAAAYLVTAKLLGVWLGLLITKVPFSIDSFQGITTLVVATNEQVAKIAFISDIVFVTALIIAGIFVLIRTHLFNDLTRNPRVLVKVIHYNLMSWLEDGQSMYPKLFAWGTFIWIGTVVVIKDVIQQFAPLWLGAFPVFFSLYYTYTVFSFLDSHIHDMIKYLYGDNNKKT